MRLERNDDIDPYLSRKLADRRLGSHVAVMAPVASKLTSLGVSGLP